MTELFHAFSDYLDQDEEVLWSGRSDPLNLSVWEFAKVIADPAVSWVMGLAIAGAAFAKGVGLWGPLGCTHPAFAQGCVSPKILAVMFFAGALVITYLMLRFSRYFWLERKADQTEAYAITQRRALRLRLKLETPMLTSIPIQPDQWIRYEAGTRGTLMFSRMMRFEANVDTKYEYSEEDVRFRNLADAEGAYRAVRSVQLRDKK